MKGKDMKRLIVLLAVLVMASVSFATDIPATNPQLALDGNTVTMKADIAGAGIMSEIKVMWSWGTQSEGHIYDENSVIFPPNDPYNNRTTTKAMYAEGWKLIHVIADNVATSATISMRQITLIFVK